MRSVVPDLRKAFCPSWALEAPKRDPRISQGPERSLVPRILDCPWNYRSLTTRADVGEGFYGELAPPFCCPSPIALIWRASNFRDWETCDSARQVQRRQQSQFADMSLVKVQRSLMNDTKFRGTKGQWTFSTWAANFPLRKPPFCGLNEKPPTHTNFLWAVKRIQNFRGAL